MPEVSSGLQSALHNLLFSSESSATFLRYPGQRSNYDLATALKSLKRTKKGTVKADFRL